MNLVYKAAERPIRSERAMMRFFFGQTIDHHS